jgi:hypothetical protein
VKRLLVLAASIGALAIPASAGAVVPQRHNCPHWYGAHWIGVANMTCGQAHRVLNVWDHTEYGPYYVYGRAWHENHYGFAHGQWMDTHIWSGPYEIRMITRPYD